MSETTKPMSTIGMKNVVLAPLTKDDESGVTYGAVIELAGAVDATITPQNTDADVQYADDGEYDAVYPDPEVEFQLQVVDVSLEARKAIFSHTIDQNGVLIKNANDKAGYFAVGFKSEKADHTYRYIWLYKVRAAPMTENYATKEGETVTRQTGTINFTAIKRTYDGDWECVADEGQNGFTAEKGATFLSKPYEKSMAE